MITHITTKQTNLLDERLIDCPLGPLVGLEKKLYVFKKGWVSYRDWVDIEKVVYRCVSEGPSELQIGWTL